MRIIVFGCLISAVVACTSNSEKEVCGNGRVEAPEECDDGPNNGALGDSCSATCTTVAPFCGDGVVDTGEQCDDGAANGATGDHCSSTCTSLAYITASWSVDCVTGTTGCTPGCPVGFDTAVVYSQKLDSTGNPVGQPVLDTFNCADGTGKTAALATGKYLEYIDIMDSAMTQSFAKSLSDAVDITSADGTFMESIYINGGYFHWSWRLISGVNNPGATVDCSQVATQNGVKLHSVSSSTTMAFDDLFTCSDYEGTTSVLATDTYNVSFQLLDNANQPLGTGEAQSNRVINDTNQVTELYPATGTPGTPIDITLIYQ